MILTPNQIMHTFDKFFEGSDSKLKLKVWNVEDHKNLFENLFEKSISTFKIHI